jgi:hypothetical protein
MQLHYQKKKLLKVYCLMKGSFSVHTIKAYKNGRV